jgi:hypothetical protein
MVLFWRNDDKGSNWNFSPSFVMDGVEYSYGEQAMMFYKAALFNDAVTGQKILDAKYPWDIKDKDGKVIEYGHKSLGRQVQNYVDDVWVEHRLEIMTRICVAKFGQIPEYREWLLGTGDMMIVEASPYDRIWGIGLEETDPRAWDPATWPAGVLNLLGIALMRAREILRAEEQELEEV